MRTLRNRVFAAGKWIPAGTAESELPAGVVISNPKAWEEGLATGGIVADLPLIVLGDCVPEVVIPTVAPIISIPPIGTGSTGDTPMPPPKTGNGSAKAVWTAYAETNGVDVSGCVNKAEIIGLLEANGIPTS